MRSPLRATDYLPDDWRESMNPVCHGRGIALRVIEELDAYLKNQPMWRNLEEAHSQILAGLDQITPIEDDDVYGNHRCHAHYWAEEIFMRICTSENALDSAADQFKQGIKDIMLERVLGTVLDGSSDLSIFEGNNRLFNESWALVTDRPWDIDLPPERLKPNRYIKHKALIDCKDGLSVFLLIESRGEPIEQPRLREGFEPIFTGADSKGDKTERRNGIEDAYIDQPSNRRTVITATSEDIVMMPTISYEDRTKLRLCNSSIGLDAYVKIPRHKVDKIVSSALVGFRKLNIEIKKKPVSPPSWITISPPEDKSTQGRKYQDPDLPTA
ncbi:hypothetical protein DL98DRAFT_535444 [Cadophora sp. DSE1049]|nr:hypothetical protein DL98DRAFT_535444 [Cadophora sp. DSE1049]